MYYTLIPFDLLATIPCNQFHSRNIQVDNRRENFYQGASSKPLLLYSLHLQMWEGGDKGVDMTRVLAFIHGKCLSS